MQIVRTDRWIRLAIVMLMAAFVYTVYAAIHETVIVAGDTSPAFQITTDSGQSVAMPNFRGKLLVLNFWASWCGPCIQETPSLSQFAQQYASRNVVVLGVSVDKDPKAYQAFLQKYRPAFLTVRESNLHAEFGTFMYPESYLIDANGKVLQKFAEAVDWSDPKITQLIDSLL